MTAYYNEIDPFAAAWLRELVKAGHIAPGEVDERSIEDVRPNDLKGYAQCHFFAGIGVWSYALRCAGWSDDRPVWTGSCPCQPFSAAGKRGGFDDERHLWPAFFHLIRECRPDTVFGEQVASKDGLAWFDLVQSDLEGTGYAVGAVDTCAAGFGAPHIRQRLYWVADTSTQRQSDRELGKQVQEKRASFGGGAQLDEGRRWHDDGYGGQNDELADLNDERSQGRIERRDGTGERLVRQSGVELQDRSTGPTNGFWRDADWLFCRDGKWRPVMPGTFPLVDVTSVRVGRLRGYGNAIVAAQAQAFIESFLERDQP